MLYLALDLMVTFSYIVLNIYYYNSGIDNEFQARSKARELISLFKVISDLMAYSIACV